MTAEERKLIDIIRTDPNPAEAMKLAMDIMADYLAEKRENEQQQIFCSNLEHFIFSQNNLV